MACFQVVHLRFFSQCKEIRAGNVHTQAQVLESNPGLYSLDINLPLGWEAKLKVSTLEHISSKGCKRISNRGDSWEQIREKPV